MEPRVRLDGRLFAGIAAVFGVFVVLSEIPFWGARSSLAPVLTALGGGLLAIAIAYFLDREH
jgi:hypothetical protein